MLQCLWYFEVTSRFDSRKQFSTGHVLTLQHSRGFISSMDDNCWSTMTRPTRRWSRQPPPRLSSPSSRSPRSQVPWPWGHCWKWENYFGLSLDVATVGLRSLFSSLVVKCKVSHTLLYCHNYCAGSDADMGLDRKWRSHGAIPEVTVTWAPRGIAVKSQKSKWHHPVHAVHQLR